MVKLLDCTLRDGGYINNWEFGYDNINFIIHELEQSNIDVIELGFLKNEPYDKDRTVYNSIDQIEKLIQHKKKDINYAAMIEVVNPISLDKLKNRNDSSIDTIRVIVWKNRHDEKGHVVDALKEGFNYCKGIKDKGYNLCIQPARIDQYSEDEFIDMINMFNELNPMAIYVVDSWGTMNSNQIMRYVELAEKNLKKGISIGYHGHNNLMQTLDTAIRFVDFKTERELMIDGSVFGIGRGAGNLNIELFANYLNQNRNTKYDINSFLNIYDRCIENIYAKHKWGYSLPYFSAAMKKCNPNYVDYYSNVLKLSFSEIEKIINLLSADDKIMYSKQKADFYLSKLRK